MFQWRYHSGVNEFCPIPWRNCTRHNCLCNVTHVQTTSESNTKFRQGRSECRIYICPQRFSVEVEAGQHSQRRCVKARHKRVDGPVHKRPIVGCAIELKGDRQFKRSLRPTRSVDG